VWARSHSIATAPAIAATSAVASTAVDNLRINAARLPDNQAQNVVVQVVTSGATGELTYSGGAIAGGTVTIEVAGNRGTEQLSFASGTAVAAIATAINAVKEATGVSAAIVGGRTPEQVDGWIDAGSIELTREDLDEIATLIQKTGAGAGPSLPR
jgi:aryl-alcohol dehydrogenase-like predicted oxidoreductase